MKTGGSQAAGWSPRRLRRIVVGVGQVRTQKCTQGPAGLGLVRTADLQSAGIVGGGVAGHQFQDAPGVGMAPVAQVAEAAGGGESEAGLLHEAGRPGVQPVGQGKDEVDGDHGR